VTIAAIGAALASSASVPTTGLAPTGSAGAATGADPTSGAGFAQALEGGLQNLSDVQTKADDLGVKAATGDLTDVHDYMIAATKAELTTELTVTLRNKALDAFNEIMRMQG
jgi:flagellar hook-basal body complex protein FliE